MNTDPQRTPYNEYLSTERYFSGSTCLAWWNGILLTLVVIESLVAAILITPIPHQIEELECGGNDEDNAECCAFYIDHHEYQNGLGGGLQLRTWLLFGISVLLLLFYTLWSCYRRSSLSTLKTRNEWHSHFQHIRWFELIMYFMFALYFVWAVLVQNHLTSFIALPDIFRRLANSCLDDLLDNDIAYGLSKTIENSLRNARDYAAFPALVLAALAMLFIAVDRWSTLGFPTNSDVRPPKSPPPPTEGLLFVDSDMQQHIVTVSNESPPLRRRMTSRRLDFD